MLLDLLGLHFTSLSGGTHVRRHALLGLCANVLPRDRAHHWPIHPSSGAHFPIGQRATAGLGETTSFPWRRHGLPRGPKAAALLEEYKN